MAPLPIGASASKTSRIAGIDIKYGKTGALAFVTVAHEIAHNGMVAVHEEHDIVYRDMPRAGAAPVSPRPAPTDALWRRRITPESVLLFRYSALTFNGHRIH